MLLVRFKKVLYIKLIFLLIWLFLFLNLYRKENLVISDFKESNWIVFVLDLSNSMNVKDFIWKYWYRYTRLEAAKLFIAEKTENLSWKRVGLIVFAWNAIYYLPPTKDRQTFLNYLKTLNTSLLSQWSNLYSWLALFINDSLTGDIWIVLSDFWVDKLSDSRFQNLANKYFLKKQKLIFVGLGSKSWWYVKNSYGDYVHKWKSLKKIISKRNDSVWEKVASYFRTKYYAIDNWDKLKSIKIPINIKNNYQKSDFKRQKIISILFSLFGL